MFVPYILVTSPKGYVRETKFKKEIEYLPVQGEPIVSFYNEIAPFYNFSNLRNDNNEGIIMVDNKLEALSEAQAHEKLVHTLEQYVSMIEATQCINLKESSRDWPSHLEELKEALALGLDMKFNNQAQSDDTKPMVVFNNEIYKQLHNELILYSSICESPIYSLMHCMVKGVNTLLADDNYIEAELDSGLFATYVDEEDESEQLSYSAAASSFRNLEVYAKAIKYNSVKKFKAI
jgi:hypothetical protein